MKYKTTLPKKATEFIYSEWVKDTYVQADTTRMLQEMFEDLAEKSYNSVRKQVAYLVAQFEEQDERPDSMNQFADTENMVAKNIQSGWIHNYDDEGKKVGTYYVKNPQGEVPIEDITESIVHAMKGHEPKYPTIQRPIIEESHLLVISPADIHIGKLCSEFSAGDEYNSQIAIQRALEGVEGIIQKGKGFDIDQILFIGGNDILHIDNPRNTTTSGTQQDVSGMRHDNYLLAQKLYVDILERLLGVADVTFLFCPSNHDYTNGFFLCNTIEAWFRECQHISFMNDLRHRKYYRYHKNLIGATHGDGAKEKDLPALMSVEAKEHWGEVEHRYYYLHHCHHKISKDYIGITLEYLRSPSGTDRRHETNGYTGVPKAIEGFIHHPNYGQVSRLTHIFS